mgnify:CR=1 FL=1
MRFEQLTQRFQQALQDAQSLAMRNDNGYLEAVHVLKVLLDDFDGGSQSLLQQARVDVARLQGEVQTMIHGLPKVTGQGGEILPSRELQNTLNLMDKAAAKRDDTFIASELFFVALLQENGATGKLLKQAGASEASLNNAIDAIRGGQSVDNANAEDAIHRSKAVGEPPLMLALSAFFALRDAVAAALGPGARPQLDAPATPEAILRALHGGSLP